MNVSLMYQESNLADFVTRETVSILIVICFEFVLQSDKGLVNTDLITFGAASIARTCIVITDNSWDEVTKCFKPANIYGHVSLLTQNDGLQLADESPYALELKRSKIVSNGNTKNALEFDAYCLINCCHFQNFKSTRQVANKRLDGIEFLRICRQTHQIHWYSRLSTEILLCVDYEEDLTILPLFLDIFGKASNQKTVTKMIKSFLESLEDPNQPLIAPNYWFLNKVGLIFPTSKVSRAIRIIIIHNAGFFVFTQYVELYVTRSDIDMVITNLKVSMLSIICFIKAYTFIIWQKDWVQIFKYVTESDKYERDTRDEARGRILDKYTKYCRKVTYFYWGLVFTTFWTTVGTPLMRYYSSDTFREELRNGTEVFPHIFSSWVPFDKYTYPGCWITVVWHVLLCAWGVVIVASYDSNIVVLMVFFGGKLELLQERCKQMLGSDERGVSDHEAKKVLREIHQMHMAHMKHMKLLDSMLSPVMFVYVVMCSLNLCASTYQLTSATNIAQKMLVAEYLVFGVAQLFIFCWHSTDVMIKNEQLSRGPFGSQWWAANNRQQRDVLLLSGQFGLNHVFTAGPFTHLTLSTFMSILKGAYSYYMILRK